LIGEDGTAPPEFSNLDKAYDTWKFTIRTPRNGCSRFCVGLVWNPL
jgi:hypothetical protein